MKTAVKVGLLTLCSAIVLSTTSCVVLETTVKAPKKQKVEYHKEKTNPGKHKGWDKKKENEEKNKHKHHGKKKDKKKDK